MCIKTSLICNGALADKLYKKSCSYFLSFDANIICPWWWKSICGFCLKKATVVRNWFVQENYHTRHALQVCTLAPKEVFKPLSWMFCSLLIISFLTAPCQMMKCANWMFLHFKMKDTYSFGWLVGKYCVHTSIFYRDVSVWLNSVVETQTFISPSNKNRIRGICLLFRRGKKSNRW